MLLAFIFKLYSCFYKNSPVPNLSRINGAFCRWFLLILGSWASLCSLSYAQGEKSPTAQAASRPTPVSATFTAPTTASAEDTEAFADGKIYDPFDFPWPVKLLPSYYREGNSDFNFGVLVDNGEYQIYRSSCLGQPGIDWLLRSTRTSELFFPKTIIYMNSDGYKNPIGGTISKVVDWLVTEKNKDTVKLTKFAWEEDLFCSAHGVDFLHPLSEDYVKCDVYLNGKDPFIGDKFLKPVSIQEEMSKKVKRYYMSKGVDFYDRKLIGGRTSFFNVLRTILDPKKQPVLFHCKGGKHRTGIIGMAIRGLQGGLWTQPFAEPTYLRITKDPMKKSIMRVQNYAEVEYVLHNPKKVRMENIEAFRKLMLDPTYKQLQKKYSSKLQEACLRPRS